MNFGKGLAQISLASILLLGSMGSSLAATTYVTLGAVQSLIVVDETKGTITQCPVIVNSVTGVPIGANCAAIGAVSATGLIGSVTITNVDGAVFVTNTSNGAIAICTMSFNVATGVPTGKCTAFQAG